MSPPSSPTVAAKGRNTENTEVDATTRDLLKGVKDDHVVAAERPATSSPRADSAEAIEAAEHDSTDKSGRSTPEEGQVDEGTEDKNHNANAENAAAAPLPNEAPPLPNEAPPLPTEAPPLPNETLPNQGDAYPDDGWRNYFSYETNSWWFYNHYTGVWQQENPREAGAGSSATAVAASAVAQVPVVAPPENTDPNAISDITSVAGGYNPAIHGDYDPNAWYAQNGRAVQEASATQLQTGYQQQYATGAYFNHATGQWQMPGLGAEHHSDEAKSRRQMNAYFDVDAAANQHDGRSLKAERSGKKPTKAELKAFKEKRKAKKEEKRRAWLRD